METNLLGAYYNFCEFRETNFFAEINQKQKIFPWKKQHFLKLHSRTEVGDHKISGKLYSKKDSIKWVNSNSINKQ